MKMKFFLYAMGAVGVCLSLIAGIYSISGLTVIFKGAFIATILMATCMEMAKVFISVYLHIFWKKANLLLTIYLTFALIILAIITSIGIYGYLSKSYMTSTDTSMSSDKVNSYDMLVQIEREKIKINSEVIASMQKTPVDQRPDWHNGRMLSLSREIEKSSKAIDKYNLELIPEKSKMAMMSLEVGSLKYVASVLYGTEGKEAIDKAVQLLILMLVCVFDPLAILLILSAIHGLELFQKQHPESDTWAKEIEETQRVKKTDTILNSDLSLKTIEVPKLENKIKKEQIREKSKTVDEKLDKIDLKPLEYERTRFADIGNFISYEEIYDKFPWLKKASITGAKISYDEDDRLHWWAGVFHAGIWQNGFFHDGLFKKSATWLAGEWIGGKREQ